jgi:hypothetical protein
MSIKYPSTRVRADTVINYNNATDSDPKTNGKSRRLPLTLGPDLKSRRTAAEVRLEKAPLLEMDDLRPGDVVMFRYTENSPKHINNIGHAGIKAGQEYLIRRQPDQHIEADKRMTHSAMCVENKQDGRPPMVVEATFPNVVKQPLFPGEHVIYRHKNPDVAATAAVITSTWVGGAPIPYGFKKVSGTTSEVAKHGAAFTAQTQEALEDKANQATTPSPEWAQKEGGVFCSELTTAAFQTAAMLQHRQTINAGTPTVFHPIIPTETKLTTPATLVHAMETSPDFEMVGKLIFKAVAGNVEK